MPENPLSEANLRHLALLGLVVFFAVTLLGIAVALTIPGDALVALLMFLAGVSCGTFITASYVIALLPKEPAPALK